LFLKPPIYTAGVIASLAAFILLAVVLPPQMWPGALFYVAVWALRPRWRTTLLLATPLLTVYLFAGCDCAVHDQLVAHFARAMLLLSGLWAFSLAIFLWRERTTALAAAPLFAWALLLRPAGVTLAASLLLWVILVYLGEKRQSARLGVPFACDARGVLFFAAVLLLAALFVSQAGALRFSLYSLPAGGEPPAVVRTGGGNGPVAPPPAAGSGTARRRAGPPQPPQTPSYVQFLRTLNVYLMSLSLFVALLVLLLAWRRLLQGRAWRLNPRRMTMVNIALTLLLAAFVLVWFVLTFHGEGGYIAGYGRPLARGAARLGGGFRNYGSAGARFWRLPSLSAPLQTLGLAVWLVFLAAALRSLLQRRESALMQGEPATARRQPSEYFAGRVRAAYRSFLAYMRPLARKSASETPREYAARVSRLFEGAAAPVRGLTALYEPVRYGGLAEDAEARRAEEFLRRIIAEIDEEKKNEASG